jgi:hypothetical protein
MNSTRRTTDCQLTRLSLFARTRRLMDGRSWMIQCYSSCVHALLRVVRVSSGRMSEGGDGWMDGRTRGRRCGGENLTGLLVRDRKSLITDELIRRLLPLSRASRSDLLALRRSCQRGQAQDGAAGTSVSRTIEDRAWK